MKIKIINTWYDVRPGVVMCDNLNETLDSVTIFLDHLTAQIAMEPLDYVELDNGKNFCISSYTERIISFEPTIYQYHIELISLTKLLEGISLPNRSITKRKYTGTETIGGNITLSTVYNPVTLELLEVGDVLSLSSDVGVDVVSIKSLSFSNITGANVIFELKEYYFYNHILKVFFYVKSKGTSPPFSGGVNIEAIPTTSGYNPIVSIKDIVDQYLESYAPKNKISGAYVPSFVLDTNEETYFECPEFQWNTPTIREVLDDIFMTRDSIAYIEGKNSNGQYVIKLKDLSLTGDEVTDKSKINYGETSQSIDSYASGLIVDAKNVVSSSTHKVTELFYRNSSKYVVSDQDYELMTQQPIWELVQLRAAMVVTGFRVTWNTTAGLQTDDVTNATPRYVDISNFVLEESVWRTKPILYQSLPTYPNTDNQNTCLYFSRGNKGIFNFSASTNRQIIFSTSRPVFRMVKDYVSDQAKQAIINTWQSSHPEGYGFQVAWYQDGTMTGGDYLDITFELTYSTLSSIRMFIEHPSLKRNFKQSVDNQSAQMTDLVKLVNLEKQKINRLSNKMTLYNSRYEPTDTIPTLGQKINNKIIFKRDIAYFNDYNIVNFYCTPDYVLKDYFTGIKSKKREWNIALANESVERHEIFKFYLGSDVPNFIDDNNKIYGNSSPSSSCVLVRFDNGDWIRMEATRITTNNNVFIHFEFDDNAIIQKKIVNRSGTGGMWQQDIFYVNGEGRATVMDIWCGPDYLIEPITQYTSMSTMRDRQDKFPYVESSLVRSTWVNFKRRINIYKDNREKLSITLQFEYNENANDVFIGRNE